MKCDRCTHQKYITDDNAINCSMGHWFGLGTPELNTDESLWDDCVDFDSDEKKTPDTEENKDENP